MANSGIAALGIILMMMGAFMFFYPVENFLKIESKMTPTETCQSLKDMGGFLLPKYQEMCDKAAPVLENPSPIILYAAYGSFGIGLPITIIGLIQKPKKKTPFIMCDECEFAANTEADLHNHKLEKHSKEEPEEDETEEE